MPLLMVLGALISLTVSSCATSGQASSVTGSARSGDVSVSVGPIGPVVGVGDSVVDAARLAAEAYLKTLAGPISAFQKNEAGAKAAEAGARAAEKEGKPLTPVQKQNVKSAIETAITSTADK